MMGNNLSRRDFLQSSALGASALALGASGTARGYSANEKAAIGFIGVGGRGTHLLTLVVEHCTDARVAAICDLIPEKIERGKKIAERDKPVGYTDFRKMMDDEKLDGIVIATQPNKHAEVVVPVLEAGFHCYAEKPMDTTVGRVDAIVAAARKARKDKGVIYQIGTQRRYHPGYLPGIKAIHDGKIGEVTFIQGHWHWPWAVGGAKVERDAGRLVEQSSHHTDVAAWAMKDQHPLRCVGMAFAQPRHPEGPNVYTETHSSTSWEFPGGIIFSYTHLFYLPRHFKDEKIWVFGTGGGVDLVHGMHYRYQPPNVKEGADPGTRVGIDSGEDWDLGTADGLQDFVANIKTGAKRMPNANVETGRISTLMCLMGRMAAVNEAKNRYEPRLIEWKDIGTTTDIA